MRNPVHDVCHVRLAHGSRENQQDPARETGTLRKLVATIPAIERKGAAHPYPSLEAFLKKYETKPFESYGVVKGLGGRFTKNMEAQVTLFRGKFDELLGVFESLRRHPLAGEHSANFLGALGGR